MYKKDYYRLSELSRNTKICIEDYRYFIENYKETLYFRLHDQPIVLIDELTQHELSNIDKDDTEAFEKLIKLGELLDKSPTKYQGLCVGSYSGMARLSKADKNTLLRESVSHTYQVVIDDIKGLKRKNEDYPFTTPLPNQYLDCWGSLHPDEQYGIPSYLILQDTGQLNVYTKRITFDDLLVQSDSVEYLEKFFKPVEANHQEDSEQSASPQTRRDDFQDLLIAILNKHPEYSSKQIWRVLEEESEDFGDFRAFDKYNLLQEITGDDIEWEDKRGKSRKSISLKALANRLTSARKTINLN
jgi:hypothetical protein